MNLLADNTWGFVLTGGFTLGPTKAAAELLPTGGDRAGCLVSTEGMMPGTMFGALGTTDEVIGCLTAVTQLTAGMMCVCGATAEMTCARRLPPRMGTCVCIMCWLGIESGIGVMIGAVARWGR